MEFQHFFDPLFFGMEITFSIIAFIFCFLIYHKTGESYELTKYEGIRYFRDSFLFFGLSYLVRFMFILVLLSRFTFDLILPRAIIVAFLILPLGYFSTVGIFYLIFSTIWKKFKGKNLIILGHVLAVSLSLISFSGKSHLILLLLQSFLLLLGIILNSIMLKGEKRVTMIRMLYLLVSVLWLANLWIAGRPRPFSYIGILFQFASLGVFLLIYYKISKWVR